MPAGPVQPLPSWTLEEAALKCDELPPGLTVGRGEDPWAMYLDPRCPIDLWTEQMEKDVYCSCAAVSPVGIRSSVGTTRAERLHQGKGAYWLDSAPQPQAVHTIGTDAAPAVSRWGDGAVGGRAWSSQGRDTGSRNRRNRC